MEMLGGTDLSGLQPWEAGGCLFLSIVFLFRFVCGGILTSKELN